MKLLTLNTHSIIEENYENKLKAFVEMIVEEKPDVFALQEVNQTLGKPIVKEVQETGFLPCKGSRATLFCDNHALRVAQMLREAGLPYVWTWIPLKVGYQKYEEGIAIFSLKPIEETKEFFISNCKAMNNWKTRKILGIKVEGIWFYSVHMGWWSDEEEPFEKQWDEIVSKLGKPESIDELSFIMGDFNCPSDVKGEGYTYVTSSGWVDTWHLAKEKDNGYTVEKQIDGWEEGIKRGIRIDYIWVNRKIPVQNSMVVFNGKNYPVVSDHYGVKIEVEIKKEN